MRAGGHHTPCAAPRPLFQDFTDLFAKARQKTGVSSAASGLGGVDDDTGKRKRQRIDPRFDLEADEDSAGSEADEDPNDKRRREKSKRYKKERAIQAINQDSRGILCGGNFPSLSFPKACSLFPLSRSLPLSLDQPF